MKTKLIVIGKTGENYLKEGILDYSTRLKHYLPFEYEEVLVKAKKRRVPSQIKKVEGEQILNKTDKRDYLVLLDEAGKKYSSLQFAGKVQKWMNTGRDLVFVIGGAYGFSEEVYNRANEKLSLSEMTFSHQMVRLFFTEQLYRAMTILKGEKYHNP